MKHKFLPICLFVYWIIGLFLPQVTVADVSSGTNTSVMVPPKSTNYQLTIDTDTGYGPIAQGSDITYTITYGASSSAAFTTNDTLTVDFSQDTFDGVTPVADYVFNSATNAYGGAVPVVDLVNRKISWTISQMPPGTIDQIVTFKMKTNSSYIGSDKIPMITTAALSNQYATLQKSLTVTYGYHISPSLPTSTTPTPTPTSVPEVTPSITPPKVAPLAITDVKFSEITSTTTTLSLDTTRKTRLRAFYGLAPETLFQLATDATLSLSHNIQLTKLTPQTKYYLKVTTVDESGNSISSDIVTFTTAKPSTPAKIEQQSVVFVSGNNPLLNTNPSLPFAQVLLPKSQTYTVGLRVASPQNIKHIIAFVENAHVLGINNFTTNTSIWSAPMVEQQPGVFIAQLAAPATPGTYDVFAQVSDISGNITQTKIAEAIVYGPIKVLDATTQKGIDHARIFLSLYNQTKKTYEPILSSNIQENPIYTDQNGDATINTGAGKYKIEVSQYGYKAQTVYFTIDKSQMYPPVIALQNIGFSPYETSQFYTNTALDFVQSTVRTLQNVSNTPRFFKLVSILVLLSSVLLTFLLFLIRTKLSLIVIPLFIKHHTQKIGSVQGQILDAITRRPIALAVVAVSNKISHEILTTTTSNNKGIFYLKNEWTSSENNINILAQGYRTNKFAVNEALFPAIIYLHHNLVGGPLHHPFVAGLLSLAGSLFETLLVASLILEIFFIPTIGTVSLIFVGLSLFNVFLWILYQRERILF